MNCQEKAAFIIPTFNAEKYISQCLDSILNQNYSNFIVIIINDGSTDSTSAILDLYKKKDSRIIVIDQNNQGQAAARNVGISVALKDKEISYISFVDSDDYIDPFFLSAHICSLIKNHADVSICGYASTNETCEEKNFYPEKFLSEKDFIKMIFSYGEWKSTYSCGGMVWKQLYKVEAIRDIRFTEDKNVVEDEIFCLKVAKSVPKFVYIPKILYYYRCVPESLTHQKKFNERLANGRKICFDLSRHLSQDVKMIVFSNFLDVTLNLIKNDNFQYDISSYKKDAIIAYKLNYITRKTLKRYFLFCYVPRLTRFMYSFEKRLRTFKYKILKKYTSAS